MSASQNSAARRAATETSSRRAPSKAKKSEKKHAPVGRRPIGPKTMNVILQVRITEEIRDAVNAMGGSTWAREVIAKALKKAAKSDDVALPQSYLDTLTKKKSA